MGNQTQKATLPTKLEEALPIIESLTGENTALKAESSEAVSKISILEEKVSELEGELESSAEIIAGLSKTKDEKVMPKNVIEIEGVQYRPIADSFKIKGERISAKELIANIELCESLVKKGSSLLEIVNE
jgi:predicted nuclease with TOPRIM domain